MRKQKNKRSKFKGIFFLFFALIILHTSYKKPVNATEFSITDTQNMSGGTFTNLKTVDFGLGYEIESSGNLGAFTWKTPNKTIGVGSAFASDGNHIYVARGYADSIFWRYDPVKDSWEDLPNLPKGTYYGADLQYLDGYIYALFGGYQRSFARYSIEDNSWELLGSYPELTYTGTSMTSDGTDIYAITGNNSQSLFKYNVETDSWNPLAGAPSTLRGGADLVHIDGVIYTPRGNNSTIFYQYEIASNTWSTLANLPASVTDDIDTTTDGSDIYVARQNNTTSFYKYDIPTNSWITLENAPLSSRYAGVQYLNSDGFIYFFRGNNDYRFWKYSIADDEFIGPQDAPSTLSTGSDMLYYNNAIYTTRGANQYSLYRFNISSNTWDTMSDAPQRFNDDTRGVVIGSKIYWFRGSNTTDFFEYDIPTDTWTTLEVAPYGIRFGGALAYPGSGDYIYATRGASTQDFARYSISTNSWDTSLTNLPSGVYASYGATLTANSTHLFFTSGIGQKRMYSYEIATDTWEEIASIPFSPFYGTDTIHNGGDKIVAIAGGYQLAVWEYSISNDTWRRLKDLQGYSAQNRGPWSGASVVYDNDNGNYYISRGGARAELMIYTPTAQDYESYGIWTSQSIDLQYVSSWNTVTVEGDTPNDSSIVVQTRSSSDGEIWSDWENLSGGNITSPVARFIRVRAMLYPSLDGTRTPVLEDITIDYDTDINPPNDPVNVLAYSTEVSGEELTSGEPYSFLNPYFTWDQSIDNETDVVGYYVYFGQQPTANPVEKGSYQTSTSFRVNFSIDVGENYLIIVAEDSLGNQSDPYTAFTYNYVGVSPVISLDIDSDEMVLGDLDGLTISDSKLKLASEEGGFWLEQNLTPPPGNLHYGTKNVAYVESTNKLYVPRGANNGIFYEYDIDSDSWTSLTDAPGNIYYGGGAVAGPDGYIYVARGYNSTDWWKYEISTDTWDTEIASAPLTIGYGGTLLYDGDQYIYVFRGNNSDAFWRYDTSEDVWETLSRVELGAPNDNVNNNVYRGGTATIDRENNLIYVIAGEYRGAFSVYSIDTDTWSYLGELPQLPYLGASLAYDLENECIYYTGGNYNPSLYKYDVNSGDWSSLNASPLGFYYGGGIYKVGNNLYGIRGNNSNGFYKYDIEKDSWYYPRLGIFGTYFEGASSLAYNYGAKITKGDGDNFYLMRGYYSDDFLKWNQITGQITRLANLPVGAYNGASMGYDSVQNKMYFNGGYYDTGFFVYDIDTNTWSEEKSDPVPIATNYGSSMIFDNNRYMYLNRGSYTNTFYRFDTQGSSGSKWETLTNSPGQLGYGAQLVYLDSYVYTLRGQNINPNPLYRYDTSGDSWDSLTSGPFQVYNDGFMVDGDNGYLYATRGSNTNEFYRYSLSGDSWESLPNFPGQIYQGGSGASNMENAIYVLPGNGSNTYQDSLYTYIMETENSSFVEDGEFESVVYDLSAVYKWGDLAVEYNLENNTNLEIYTSTSSDNNEWEEWSAVNRHRSADGVNTYRINSTPQRYIKVKSTLSSGDGIYSPQISNIQINYYRDTSNPTNPDLEGISAIGSSDPLIEIETNTWYNYSTPQFSWPEAEDVLGASDGMYGSGVSGYHIYWGTQSDGEPSTLIQGSTYSPSELVSGNTYYLRIQAVDDAGNLAEEILDAFSYKFDSSVPDAPSDLAVDPSNYTSTNSFNFTWSEVVSDGAPVEEYCYKTAATSGDLSIERCTEDNFVNSMEAYRVGSNTFMVRTKDEAGNLSTYSTISYFYVDSENAPAPPRNLSVSPTESTTNMFGFTWDPPAVGTFYGSQSNLSYLYSVNALPTPHSVSPTSLLYLNPGAYATLPGENIFYIVTKDEAGNVNYNDYISISFFANTVAPGIPIDLEIADVSVKTTSSWRLAVSWDQPIDEGSGVSSYRIYRSIDDENYIFHASTGGTSLVDSRLIQQTYYYKVQACDSTNNCGAFSSTVSLYPDGRYITPADLIVDPVVSNVAPKRATVSWITDRTADSKIAYGTEPGVYFEEEVANSDQVVEHVLTLNNLTPGTTYYYVAKWTDEDGNTGVSEEGTFVTSPPPSIQEPVVKRVGLTSALIEFTTRETSKVRILYGETSAFGGMVEVFTGLAEGTHNVELTDLRDGVQYFYRINTFDIDGAEYEGEIHSFETLPRPQISNVKIYQVTGTAYTTLLVEWSVNTPVSSVVTYYPTNSPEKVRDQVNVKLKAGVHRMVLLNLEPNTSYTVIVGGRDFMGNEATGGVNTFATASDTRPPQIFDLEVSSEIVGVAEEATAQVVVSYKTDEPATSQVEYGDGTGSVYAQKTQEDGSLAEHHIVIISGLIPDKVYHLRAVSKDSAGNVGYSIDKVVVTPPSTESAFNLAVKNLTSIFGFLGR